MSSTTGGSESGNVSKPFYCYQCDRRVTISFNPSSDPCCPLCNGGFIEEESLENPNPNPNLNPNPLALDPLSSFLSLLLDPTRHQNNPNNPFANPNPNNQQDPLAFDPYTFIQNRLSDLHAGGAQIQFVVENNQGGGGGGGGGGGFSFGGPDHGFRLAGNIGDYFVGPGLEQLIQQLAENDPNRYGTPPASKSAIDALPTVKITEQTNDSEMNQCAVCMDVFETGSLVKQMPCNHMYHNDCILPWLELHNSCPVCRYELPTDDQEYETQPQGGAQGSAAAGSQTNRGAERSFRISLPWPFGGRGSGSGTSGNNSETTDEPLD
ncbi:hypothetical protein ACFE04_021111 [Oxalis oulophora]